MNVKLAIVAVGLCGLLGVRAEMPTPISYWAFDDPDNLGADSVGNNHLSAKIASNGIYDTPKTNASAHVGFAVDFRRSSAVGNAFLGGADGLPYGTNPFSISLWIKPCANTTHISYIIANLGITGGVPGGWSVNNTWSGWYLRFASDGKLAWGFNGWRVPPSASSTTDVLGTIPYGSYKDGAWHLIVMTRDSNGRARLYWDGRKIGESTITYSIPTGRRLLIGSYDAGNVYDGYYDEIKCYDTVLTDAQIVQQFYLGNSAVNVDDDGRIFLDAAAGAVVTNEISYSSGLGIAKTGEGTVLLWHSSGNYNGSVGVTNGLLRTGEVSTFLSASAFRIEDGAMLEFGRSGNYAAPFSGAGTMRFTGHGAYNLTGGISDFTGTLASYFGTVNFGAAGAPVIPSVSSSLDVDGGGFLNFFGNVSVASISGEGLLGGVSVPDGGTFTVSGEQDSSFAGRLGGKGTLVKNGVGTLTLSGASSFTNLTVNAGAVALVSAVPTDVKYRLGLRGYWNFDDADSIGVDGSLNGSLPLVADGYGEYRVELVDDGVSGKAVHIVQPNTANADCFFLRTEGPGTLPSGTEPFTVSAWIRPRGNIDGYCYLLRRSDFSGSVGGTWNHDWNHSWMISTIDSGKRMTFEVMSKWVDAGNDTAAAVGKVDFSINTWHHIVGTRNGRDWKLYFDGQLVGSYTHSSDHSISSNAKFLIGSYGCHSQPQNAIDADYDEVQYLSGAWTAEQVAAEFAARKPKLGIVALPSPLAHWTFDEFETDEHGRFFRDLSASGWHFYEVKNGEKTVSCIDASHDAGKDVNGGAAYVDSSNVGAYLKVGDYIQPKDSFGGSNPDFTLSIRLRNVQNNQSGRQVILSFGNAQAGQTCLRLTSEAIDNANLKPRIYRVIPGLIGLNNAGYILDDTYNSYGNTTPWTTLTFVCKAGTRMMTVYRDGVRIGEYPSKYDPLTLDRILLLSGYNYTAYSGFAVDDLRVYRELLNDVQIQLLVREQAGVTTCPVDTTEVKLAPSSSLAVKSGTHVAASITGAGGVTVAEDAVFGARDYSGFMGSISGSGTLALAAKVPNGVSVSLPAAKFPNDTIELSLATKSTPFVDFSGKVTLPATGTLRLADSSKSTAWLGKVFKLANCASYEGPADTTGWTFDPPLSTDVDVKNRFIFANGELRLSMGGSGVLLIFR